MSEIIVTPEIQQAMDIINNTNKNLLISGQAGTGKSSFLTYFKQQVQGKYNYICLAPTGIASINVEGMTIHKFFGFHTGFHDINNSDYYSYIFRNKVKDVLEEIDFIIIDEISMVRADLFDAILQTLQFCRKRIRIICLGDLGQLKPVLKNEDKKVYNEHYDDIRFYYAKLFKVQDWSKVLFKTVFRQKDPVLKGHLNNIRNKKDLNNSLAYFNERYNPNAYNEEGIIICNYNQQVDKINVEELAKVEGESKVFKAKVNGDFPESMFPCQSDVELKVGCRVMCIKNCKLGQYVNGTTGNILKFNKDSITVKTEDGGLIDIPREKWQNKKYEIDKSGELIEEELGKFEQYPLRLAYAVTTHKSQGKTFNNVIIDKGRGFFDGGQLYVALSRCTTLEGIHLVKKLDRGDIK